MVSSYARSLRAMMGQEVTIEHYIGPTGNGGKSYDPAKTYSCYVYQDYRLITNVGGQQAVSSARTHIYPVATDGTVLAALGPEDRITLPDGKQPRLLSAETQYDHFGKLLIYVAYT